ncbi:MAG: hypothetical protein AAF961_03235 [Planctomycetota bacterium]
MTELNRRLREISTCLAMLGLAAGAPAQGQFSVVLNIPPDTAPASVGAGTQLNLSDGGWVGQGFQAEGGSEVNVLGGLVGEDVQILGDSTLNISGGSVGDFLYAGALGDDGGDVSVNISGGTIGTHFSTGRPGSVDLSVDVNMSGGSIGRFFAAFGGSTVNVNGGEIGAHAEANSGSVVNLSGGSIGGNFDAWDGSAVNISDGSVGIDFNANSGSMVHISGGSIEAGFDANEGSMVNISGGLIGDAFTARSNSQVKLFGTQFILDGADVTSTLTLNTPAAIAERDVTLSGMLADGSPFSFDLHSSMVAGGDLFLPDATLQLTLVPPGNIDPIMLLPAGDFNSDGAVDGGDFLAWQRGQSPRPNSTEDLVLWESRFGAAGAVGSQAGFVVVPEPCAWITALTAAAALRLAHRRRNLG